MSRKVVLFYPPYEGTPLGAPLCLLALAASLRAVGFQPVIIDAAVVRDYKQAIREAISDAVCFGSQYSRDP